MFDVLVSVSSVKHCDNDYLIRRPLDCPRNCCHSTELNYVYQAAMTLNSPPLLALRPLAGPQLTHLRLGRDGGFTLHPSPLLLH